MTWECSRVDNVDNALNSTIASWKQMKFAWNVQASIYEIYG